MKLWGGRFTKETNQLVHNFNASLSFDQKFYEEDIEGSIAHVTMLAEQGILTNEDKEAIIGGLQSIRDDIRDGKLVLPKSTKIFIVCGGTFDRAHWRCRQTPAHRTQP